MMPAHASDSRAGIPDASAPPAHPFIERIQAATARMCRNGVTAEDVGAAAGLVQFLPGVVAAAYDADARYVWVSASFSTMLGIDPQSVIGNSIRRYFPAPWSDERTALMQRALANCVPLATIEIFRGRRFEGLVLPIRDSRPLTMMLGRFGIGSAMPDAPPHGRLIQAIQLEHADWGPLSVLSRRELDILRHIALGLDNPEIARAIHRTKRAVEWHIGHLYTFLGCEHRTELFRIGLEAGLHEIGDEQWSRTLTHVAAIRETTSGHSHA